MSAAPAARPAPSASHEAKPDGYTFVLGTVGTHAQSQTLSKKPLYNAATDFTPVALIAEVPIALIARKDFPADNLKDFIAYSKANASKMKFGSAGAGSATHLGCVVANMVMGTDIVHVPYKGTGPAMQDLQGGRIDFLCEIISTAKPQIDGGTVKAIAIMTKDRSAALPNLPTAEEQGTQGHGSLYLERDFPAQGHAGADRQEARRRSQPGDGDPGGEGASGCIGCDDCRAGSPLAGISPEIREERNREVARADPQERCPDQLTADVKNSTAADRPVRRCFF